MEMDFEKAFKFITEDKDWKKKLAIGGGLELLSIIAVLVPLLLPVVCLEWQSLGFTSFLALFATGLIIFSVLNLAILGYLSLTTHNRIHNHEKFLPEWSGFGHLIITGLKTVIGHVLFFLPFIFISGIFLLVIMTPSVFQNSLLSSLLTALFTIAGLFGYFILYVFIVVFYFLLFGSFLKDLKMLSFLNFKAAIALVKNNIINYLIFWLLIIVISIMVQFISILLVFTIVGIVLVPWLIFYSSLITADVIAQFVKTSKE